MPSYLSPGVYVEEVSSGIKPIEGVGTATGAFIGIAERGPVGKPMLVTNWTQYQDTFGGFIENGFLAYAVFQFFNEGGTACYVIRAAIEGATNEKKLGAAKFTSQDLVISANSDGIWGNSIEVTISDETPEPPETGSRTGYFKMSMVYKDWKEEFDHLTMDDTKPDHVIKRVASKLIVVQDTGATRPDSTAQPVKLAGGKDGDTIAPNTLGQFLTNFDPVDDINIVAIPDAMGDPVTTKSGLTYCQNLKDCFFVADMPEEPGGPKKDGPTDALKFRLDQGFSSSYGAIYYPWLTIFDPLTKKAKKVPPSGAVVGTYAHTDTVRGVHKAPAGIDEGYLNSAMGVVRQLTRGEHDILNPKGVNVIRSFQGLGTVVWGARTLSSDPEWRYINVRRLFLFIEESIDEGTQWVVFEPNTPILWGKGVRQICG